MTAEKHNGYEIRPFPRARLPVLDVVRMGHRKHTIHGLLEVDVTEARQIIQEHKAQTGERLSFTAFVAICLAKAVEMNRHIQAVRDWRGRLLLFDDVDVSTNIEIEVDGRRFPLPYVIKAANRKSYREVHDEIREIQAQGGSSRAGAVMQWFASMPGFARRIFWWYLDRKPHMRKERFGTVGLTAIGMFGEGSGWGVPIYAGTLLVTVGGIGEKPGVFEGRIEIREYVSLTVSFDHDIVDGGPAARFTQQFKELLESGYGIKE